MSRVITFSTVFPSYHPRKGEPTYFVEKLITSLVVNEVKGYYTTTLKDCRDKGILKISNLDDWQKGHTIRAGHRWKVGDWFSPRVWSGKPYQTPMIIIGPDIQIKKIFNFQLRWVPEANMNMYGFINDQLIDNPTALRLAHNDGLTLEDFEDWFKPKQKLQKSLTAFDGQILVWNENINY